VIFGVRLPRGFFHPGNGANDFHQQKEFNSRSFGFGAGAP
jgi:hypothetical protein